MCDTRRVVVISPKYRPLQARPTGEGVTHEPTLTSNTQWQKILGRRDDQAVTASSNRGCELVLVFVCGDGKGHEADVPGIAQPVIASPSGDRVCQESSAP